MTSKVEICNLALGHCRASNITQLNEGSNEADQCNRYYNIARKFVLENTPWGFAHKIAALSLHTEDPKRWLYSYAKPSNCLTIRCLLPDVTLTSGNNNNITYRLDYYHQNYDLLRDRRIPYEQGTNSNNDQAIWTNEADAYISYTFNQEDTSQFTNAFITALSHYLAAMIAIPVVGRKEGRVIKTDNYAEYGVVINTAISNDDNEGYQGAPRESDMITVRNS